MGANEHDLRRLEFVERAQFGSCFIIRIPPGENLIRRIQELLAAKECRRAAILSGIGSLRDVTFRNLVEGVGLPVSKDKTIDTKREGPFELVSLVGNLIPMLGRPVTHLHAVLGTPDGQLVGGHLFDATVFDTVELVIAEIVGSRVVKGRDESTGLAEMKIAE